MIYNKRVMQFGKVKDFRYGAYIVTTSDGIRFWPSYEVIQFAEMW